MATVFYLTSKYGYSSIFNECYRICYGQTYKFFENDNNWFIDLKKKDSHIKIAKKINYTPEINFSAKSVSEHLKCKIKESLKGEAISNVNHNKIINYFSLKYYSSNKRSSKNAFIFLRLLRFYIGHLDSYTNTHSSWQQAKEYLEYLIAISAHNDYFQIALKDTNPTVTESVKYLINNRYNITISCDNIYLEKRDEDKLFKAIEFRFKKIGINALLFTLQYIYGKYDHETSRYFLRSEPGMIDVPKADIPWGYIFNLSLANLHDTESKKQYRKIFLDSIELLKHFFCIQRMQTFSKYGDIHQNHETILEHIQKNILYDQHFSIDQISSKHIYKIISCVFSSKQMDVYDTNIKLYLSLIDFVNLNAKLDKPLQFTEDDFFIYSGNYLRYNREDITELLGELSFTPNEINNNYLKPDDINKRNYFEKPFVKIKNKYVYINPIFNNFGFYASLQRKFLEKGADGNVMGKAIESFVEKLLVDNGLIILSGKKYDVAKDVADELSIRSTERECDFILETKDTIFSLN
ncbi:hypothetical protein [Aeromonas jandaei]|uniref:hypothetical protein n=1 Tax=Aeromonas jandaei TaxID=650 RepID=UPI003EC7F7FE